MSTTSPTNITATEASSGGNITSDGNAGITSRGVCWGVNGNPTTSDSKTNDGDGMGQFVSNLSGLNAGLTYHLRAYATNSVGTAYGDEITFLTLGKVPEAITQPATNITTSGATLNGTVNAHDLTTDVSFEYGLTTNYGQTINAAQSQVTGNSITNVSANISILTPGTTYHYRVKSVNSLGTTNGNDLTLTTVPVIPTLTTTPVTNRTTITAMTGGNITSDGGAAVTSRGVCWATTQNPTISNNKIIDGTGTGSFTSNMTGLQPETTYYVRAFATNSVGTAYGNQFDFKTLSTNMTVTDVDGNVYNTIPIGTQIWTKQNLKVTKYRNGDLIGTTVPSSLDISSQVNPKYQWSYKVAIIEFANSLQPLITGGAGNLTFNQMVAASIITPAKKVEYESQINALSITYDRNNTVNQISNVCNTISTSFPEEYGRLYTWYTVTDSRNVCPDGWHLPNRNEWVTLTTYLGGVLGAGNKMKTTGSTLEGTGLWPYPNYGTNESGFSAVPAGSRGNDGAGKVFYIGEQCIFWLPEYFDASDAYLIGVGSGVGEHAGWKWVGASIRCIKD